MIGHLIPPAGTRMPTASDLGDPAAEYELRLADRQQTAAACANADQKFSQARGLVFLSGLALAFVVWNTELTFWWLFLPIAAFMGLVIAHGKTIRQLVLAERAARYYATAQNRIRDQWMSEGVTGERYHNPDHPYAGDLDLFGQRSLFQLICQARTRLGENALAAWLKAPADADTIKLRQDAIEELRSKLDLRERLALLDAEVHDGLDQRQLLHWANEPAQPISWERRAAAVVISALMVGGITIWLLGAPLRVILIPLLVLMGFTALFVKSIRRVARTMDAAGSGLAILSQVLEVIEREEFQTARLKDIRRRLETDGHPPSWEIARLNRMIQSLRNSLQNQFFAIIAFVLCLEVHLVHAIEVWRERVGTHIPDWLDAVGEFEALSSLAGYAYEHPQDPFPELVGEFPLLDAVQVGHPLIPGAVCIRNDVRLDDELRLILVSGSNMSGKSTLLRTIGTNVVLALCGAPVRAKSLRLSPVQVGTAMRINDSLQDGKSLFYSVVSRLKMVVDLTQGERPLLFLLDEILQGTNSHDRRVGAEGVIRKLVDEGAMGLVTTHDLALTEIVDSLGGRAKNCHFEDQLVGGKMTFDYRIRPGIVQKSNALELMRLLGLDV
jgi:hypothetical protein